MAEINLTNLAFKTDELQSPEHSDNGTLDLPLDLSLLDLDGPASNHEPDHSDSISDALIKCIRDTGSVDIGRIAESAGAGEVEVIESLRGAIYRNPDTWEGMPFNGWQTADEYLSGNLREKLIKARIAYKLYGGSFEDNVKALESLLPAEMKAEDIYVTLGSPWLPSEIVDDFVNYLIQPHEYDKCSGTKHDEETGSWEIPDKSRYKYYVRNDSTFGTSRIDAVHIIERTLNMKTIKITDEVSSKRSKSGFTRVVNKEETAAAQEKQNLIIAEFKRWIWKDAERLAMVKKVYENKYGCMVARIFDGRFLEFPGMSDSITMYPYQKDAVARILFTPNTLLAHDVGAGKTYIMIAAAMELRRMGMADKCMFAVPNNLVEQWHDLFITLYPDAKVLCVAPKDMDPDRRNGTMRAIKNGSYDGIIIAYSCFDRIPLSKRSHLESLTEERNELLRIKDKKKKVTGRFQNKLDKLSKEISKLAVSGEVKNDDIYFDELGIDRLFVDEAHNYKNVSIYTSIHGVYGINQKGSSKCDSMMDKVHYIQKHHNGGGVVMATGTPITNSVSDIFVFQKYLQSGELELLGLQTFDGWVGMFAEKTTEFEIAVDTGSFRLATRFSRFHNIPELTTILASVADFHSVEVGGDIPDFNGYTDVLIPRSDALKEYLEEISKRADDVHNRKVSPEEDNMLKITTDGRKAALDVRLVNGQTDASAGSCKVSECAKKVAGIWHDTREDRLAQLVFCDTSTPKAGFNMYDELKDMLIGLGVHESDIAYIHSANTERRREKLFEDVRNGRVRVLIGSTFKLGLGVNVQDRLIAVHHLDLPWRPADMVQREGRILRSGNQNDEVEIYRYITEGSFDAYSWQLLETKQRFIADILSGTIAGRSGGEVDDTVLDYAEVKALALGNPLLKSRVEARNEITRLAILRSESIQSRLRLEQRYEELPDLIAAKKLELDECRGDADFVYERGKDLYSMIGISKKEMAEFRKFIREDLAYKLQHYAAKDKEKTLYRYRDFMIVLPAHMDPEKPYIYLVREGRYRVDLSDKETGILIRIDNYLDKLNERADMLQRQLDILLQEKDETEYELSNTDDYAEMIEEYTARLEEIDKKLGVDEMRGAN